MVDPATEAGGRRDLLGGVAGAVDQHIQAIVPIHGHIGPTTDLGERGEVRHVRLQPIADRA